MARLDDVYNLQKDDVYSLQLIQTFINPKIINKYSVNIFQVLIDFDLLTDGNIVLELPSQMKVNESSLSCGLNLSNSQIITSVKSCVYSKVSNVQKISIKISTNLNLINSILDIQIKNGIQNPPSLYSDSGKIQVFDQNNNFLDGINNIEFIYQVDQIYPTLISSSQNAGGVSVLTFSFKPTNPIPKGGSILIQFPYFNQSSGAPDDSLISMINRSTLPALLQPKGISNNSNLTIDLSDISTYIKIENIFPDADSDTSSDITFSISQIFNPLTTAYFTGYTITTLDALRYKIDRSTSLGLKVTNPAKVTFLMIKFTKNTINQDSYALFSFNVESFLAINVKIELIFPSDYPLSYSTSFLWVEGKVNMNSNIDYKITLNKLMLTNPTNKYYPSPSNTQFSFALNSLKNPQSTKPTGSFGLNIYSPEGDLIYTYYNQLVYTAYHGNFNLIKVIPSAHEINISAQYEFSINLGNNMLTDSFLKITFPKEIIPLNLSFFKCIISTSTSETINAECELSQDKNMIYNLYIRNGFKNGYNANTILTFTLSQILNPPCALTSNSFIVESYTQDNYVIDKNESDISVTFNEGQLKNISIMSSSNASSEIGVYTVSFNISNKLEINSIIKIKFPNDVVVNNGSNTSTFNCLLAINYSPINNFSCSLLNQEITISDFNLSSILTANTAFEVQIPNVKNKRNLIESNLFSVTTFSGNIQCKVDKNFIDLKVKNTVNPKIISIIISAENILNGNITNYAFTITSYDKLIATDQIKFYIPDQIRNSPGLEIIILGNNIEVKTQILEPDELGFYYLKIEKSFIDIISFKILALKNYYSTREIDNFKFWIVDSSGAELEYYDDFINNPLKINQISNFLKSTKVEVFNQNNIILSFSCTNIIPLNGIIKIKILPIITDAQELKCEDLSIINKKENLTCQYESPFIIINNKFSENRAEENDSIIISISNISFTAIQPITNQSNDPITYNLDIETFEKLQDPTNSNNFIFFSIDKKSDLSFSLGCNNNCLKCLSDGKTCVQCLSNLYILKDGICMANCPENSPYLFEDETYKSCYSDCPLMYYADNSSKKCLKCQSPCKECFSLSECKNCTEGFLYYSYQKYCFASCPFKTIKSENICIDCDKKCLSCSPTDYRKCESCSPDKILYNFSCIKPEDCPKGTLALNGKCQSCDLKCDECLEKPDKCIKCSTGYILDSTTFNCFQEKQDCSKGYYLDKNSNNQCKPCKEKCLECDSESICTKCSPGFSLEINDCVKSCSVGFYFNLESLTCQKCNHECYTCDKKSDTCTSCNNFSYLFNFKCDYSCPEGYYKDKLNYVCKKCENTCQACEDDTLSSSDNVTGDLTNKCLLCAKGLYLNNGLCLLKCPNSYVSDDATGRCISSRIFIQNKSIYLEISKKAESKNFISFYSLLTTLFLLIIFYYMKMNDRKLYYFGVSSGFISFIDLGTHFLTFYFYFVNSYTFYFLISGGILIFRMILNSLFLYSYNSKAKNDIEFTYWLTFNYWKDKLNNLLIIIDYKTIRLSYSRLLNYYKMEIFDNKYRKYSHIHNIYICFRVFDLIIVDLGIYLNCILFLYYTKRFIYIWFLTGELLLIRFILFVLINFDVIVNKNIDEDFYYQKKYRIDVVPYVDKKVEPYKEKYGMGLEYLTDSYITSKSIPYQNTNYTLKKSNSEKNLVNNSRTIENWKSNSTYKLAYEAINPYIPKDDFYLNKRSENSQIYFKKILYKSDLLVTKYLKNQQNVSNFNQANLNSNSIVNHGKFDNAYEKKKFLKNKNNNNNSFETCPNSDHVKIKGIFKISDAYSNSKIFYQVYKTEETNLYNPSCELINPKNALEHNEKYVKHPPQEFDIKRNDDNQTLMNILNEEVSLKGLINKNSLIFNNKINKNADVINDHFGSYLDDSYRSNINLKKNEK